MSTKPKQNAYSASNINTAVLQELADVAEIGVFGDLSPLVLFVQKNHLITAITNITYFSSVNDIGSVARNAKRLSQVLGFINYVIHDAPLDSPNMAVKLSLLDERERIAEFYNELCTTHLKTIYKFYSMRKPLAVIALTGLLTALVEYKNHHVLTTLQDTFDFSHSTLPKIMTPTRDEFEKNIIDEFSMRYAVMDFWMVLCAHSNSSFRKSLLTNFKIMNNVWKYIEMERYETLLKIFKFLEKSVLNEPSFKRSSKCQILNENFLFNLRNVFALVKGSNDRKDDTDISDFDGFKKDFEEFINILVSDQAKGITYPQNEHGTPLVVNNKTFKINNKLIYTLLTTLKPWDSHPQLQFCIRILNYNQELVPPYMNWIVASSGGYHDPSLTSYWIGHTLLYTEILKSRQIPSLVETVSLAPLSKQAMTECLTFPSDLVKQLGLQLILLQLLKLTESSSPVQSLVESVLGNLPEQANFVPLMTHENKLIKLTSTLIIKRMEQLVPSSSSSAIVSLVGQNLAALNLDESATNSLELVMLDTYLSIQSNNDLKWWNKSAKGNSFFTSLLKLTNIDFLIGKVYNILEKLTRSSFIFGKDTLIESPLLMLIEATSKFVGSNSSEKLWNCLDETISRSMKTPYKYLDKSHTEYDDVSVFVVALFEQLKFIKDVKKDADILTWLKELANKLVVVGESRTALLKLAADHDFDIQLELNYSFKKDNVISKFDFAQAVLALNQAVAKSKENQVMELATKLGGYILGSEIANTPLFTFLTTSSNFEFFGKLTSAKLSQSEALALSILAEIYQQLDLDYSKSQLNEFIFENVKQSMPKKNQLIALRFLWILTDAQIAELANHYENDSIVIKVYQMASERNLHILPDFKKLSQIQSTDLQPILLQLKDSVQDVEVILSNPTFHFLLEEENEKISAHLETLATIPDDILYRVAPVDIANATKHKDQVTKLALGMQNFLYSLRIFTAYPKWFSSDDVLKTAFAYVDKSPKSAMTSEFANFLSLFVSTFDIQESDPIKLWLQRAMIYITKKFAELPELSANFDGFLSSIAAFTTSYKQFRSKVPKNVLNTQFEVLLAHKKWVTKETYLEYANRVLLKLDHKGLNAEKLLQILVTNENNALWKLPDLQSALVRFQTALLIHVLYNLTGPSSSTITLTNQILALYLGSTRAEDLLLKDVLTAIEAKSGKSWVANVINWDFIDEMSRKEVDLVGEERLIIKDKSNLVVALNKTFVLNTVKHMDEIPSVPQGKDYESLIKMKQECFVGEYFETVYDSEFLLLVILNNEELFSEEEGKFKFNMAKIIDSGFLHFIVMCLSLESTRDVAKVILHGMLKYLTSTEENIKDKNIIKIYISSILHTLRVSDHSTPLVWYFIGEFANIITNPGHFLYEHVFRFILSTPKFQQFEIPLYRVLAMSLPNEDSAEEDNYYKQITWLLELLTASITSSADLKVLKFRDVIEWAFNVYNLSYASAAIKSKIMALIHRVSSLNVEGTDLLLTKFAGFTSLDISKHSIQEEVFSSTHLALNVDQVALRTGIVGQSQKRLREWSDGNIERAVKRIHN